jgi:hypothetical protein
MAKLSAEASVYKDYYRKYLRESDLERGEWKGKDEDLKFGIVSKVLLNRVEKLTEW